MVIIWYKNYCCAENCLLLNINAIIQYKNNVFWISDWEHALIFLKFAEPTDLMSIQLTAYYQSLKLSTNPNYIARKYLNSSFFFKCLFIESNFRDNGAYPKVQTLGKILNYPWNYQVLFYNYQLIILALSRDATIIIIELFFYTILWLNYCFKQS